MRFIALLLLLLVCFSLASCPKKDTGATDNKSKPAGQNTAGDEGGGWDGSE